jgi:hypothetical protein
MISLDDLRRNDPDDARMPAVTRQRNRRIAREALTFDLLYRFGQNGIAERAALAVQGVELGGEPPGFFEVVCQQQVERGAGIGQTSGRVDAGGERV